MKALPGHLWSSAAQCTTMHGVSSLLRRATCKVALSSCNAMSSAALPEQQQLGAVVEEAGWPSCPLARHLSAASVQDIGEMCTIPRGHLAFDGKGIHMVHLLYRW